MEENILVLGIVLKNSNEKYLIHTSHHVQKLPQNAS